MISAFDQPRFKFNAVRKVFTRVEHKRSLHGDANDKASDELAVDFSIALTVGSDSRAIAAAAPATDAA